MSSNLSERRPLLHRNLSRNISRNSHTSRLSVSQPPTPTTNFQGYNNNGNVRRNVRLASAAILFSLVFERIAFYGIAGNLVLFLNKDPFRWESYHAIDASLYFFGMCFVTSLIGGWLADSVLGRFKALLFSFMIYVIGYIFMPLMTSDQMGNRMMPSEIVPANQTLPSICKWGKSDHSTTATDKDPFDENCASLIFITLTIIAIGTGFVKANIAPFGSDQVAQEGQQATLSFFNWFYWSINLGALVGLSVITYVQQQKSFFYGYLASVCCLGISVLLFIAGRCFYHVRAPDGSVLTNIFRIIREAFRRKRLRAQQVLISRVSSESESARAVEEDEADEMEMRISFLDYAKHRHGGVFHDALVEDVKQLKKIFAVFLVLIPYWLVYFQMQTTFLVQGLHMRLVMPFQGHTLNKTQMALIELRNASSLPEQPLMVAAWFSLFDMIRDGEAGILEPMVAAWFSLFDVIMLIILLPLFDRVIYPWWERRSGNPVSISWRILLGMVFATSAMVVAGVVEHFRLKAFWPFPDQPCKNASITQIIGDTPYQAADMSILFQIPQYALIGLSEVFTSVAGLQFAVSVAPRSMKGIIMGLFYLFSGIGSFLGTAIIAGLSAGDIWFHARDYGNINCRLPCKANTGPVKQSCHLDYYFYLLGGIEVVGALLFLLVSKVYHLDEHHRHSRAAPALVSGRPGDFLDPSSANGRSHRSHPHSIQRNASQADSVASS